MDKYWLILYLLWFKQAIVTLQTTCDYTFEMSFVDNCDKLDNLYKKNTFKK